MHAAVRDDVVDGDDIGVVQGRGGLRLLNEAALALGLARKTGGEDFDRDRAVQPRILGFINLAHAARAELLEQLVVQNTTFFAFHGDGITLERPLSRKNTAGRNEARRVKRSEYV